MRRFLFIGGPLDGEYKLMDSRKDYRMKTITYSPKRWAADGSSFFFYAPVGMSDALIMGRLLDFYSPGSFI